MLAYLRNGNEILMKDRNNMGKDNIKQLISVIVPVYNVEKYLSICLDSIVEQTYKELEVIMVDDGSKDSSGKICDIYAQKYSNFHVVHKENAGLGMARNTGMEHMNGSCVVFLDSDDYLSPDCIEILYKELEKNKVDMCKGGFFREVDSGKVVLTRKYENKTYIGESAKKELLPRMIGSSPSQHDSVEMCVCGAIYKTWPITQYGLRFPSERELISEDLVFNIDYMQYAQGACLIENVGYHYRINEKSLSKCYRPDRYEASVHFHQEMKKKLIELQYDKQTLFRLDRMLFVYLRMCIGQETKAASGSSKKECVTRIKQICSNEEVRRVIKNYPIEKLGIAQNVFLFLIRHKKSGILYVMSEFNIM